ncbi:hypothetical protein E3P92_01912 [Wallemia ichthyophaga]|uniref:Riboflavin synthase n=2 Tax=Wallemia ichthyophaga TaxID=245174 RepID=A0A4T0F655_WALIC|nr:Riboflavin synthase alpha chain [Wallemia ichthyophaga EXF-994]TIA72909.1 hypothetical protein E3P91_01777 [Wallemia ichthyophaga]EOR02771.1 Riboflavin synthase alpha chain [Wallemia ichthyophaga EXF-994]TIA82056.1 hypothetical protein E3P98_01691 [Wallemia ichthyophaga]TIA91506.1 hypothetical protein E3P97_01995 [Wallemia ichthyophaga]TIB00434.1 hypothetical protein E3P95_01706 [Wallemia ichthyophaga]
MVFTGLIEAVGKVQRIEQMDESENGGWSVLLSTTHDLLSDCHNGDSIAINGTCLTVVSFESTCFKVGLAPETLQRTNLGELRVGDEVNLERAMQVGTRLGGHIVQGHVDTTTRIMQVDSDGASLRYKMEIPPKQHGKDNIAPYIIPKGYITIDGASLTVTHVDTREKSFGVMLIPYTQSQITLSAKKPGNTVNLEVDMVGKYVENAVEALFEEAENVDGEGKSTPQGKRIALEGFVERAVERVLEKKGIIGKAAQILGR